MYFYTCFAKQTLSIQIYLRRCYFQLIKTPCYLNETFLNIFSILYSFEVYVISSECLKENCVCIQELFSIAWKYRSYLV